MEKIKLGKTNIDVSTLAMGSDLIGSKISREQSFTLLDFFSSQGGTFLDTANMYSCWLPGCVGGESESTIGAWMKDRGNRDNLVISTKLAFDYPGTKGGLSAGEIKRECEKSLRRLQTDRIDVYYSHLDDRETSLEETMQAFHNLVKEGKVRALGASNLATWRIAEANTIARANAWTPYSLVEQRYTYLRPRHGASFGPQIFISPEMKDFALAEEIVLIGYSILLQGAYTRPEKGLPAQFVGPEADARLAALKTVAGQVGCTPNQVIIAWMRQSTPPVFPIIAGSRTEQLQENIDALTIKLTGDQMHYLDTAGDPVVKTAWIQPT
jgi:aryl-alcohol dehydrogenase-like predicted oxidoreductase